MSDPISHKHQLADGRSVWIQHTDIPWAGPEHEPWSLVIAHPTDAPEIQRRMTKDECLELLADVLRDDVCETM